MNAQSGRDAFARLAAQLQARGRGAGGGGGGIPGGKGSLAGYGLAAAGIAAYFILDASLFNGKIYLLVLRTFPGTQHLYS